MSASIPLPLNEPQQRRLTVALASLEKHLATLRERLECGPHDLRLTHHQDQMASSEAAELLPVIREAEARLRRIADDLGLAPQTDSVRRTLVAALEMASIHLYECRPGGGLNGCGAVAPTTADYLEREIPKLDEVIWLLLRRLESRPPTKDCPPAIKPISPTTLSLNKKPRHARTRQA